MIWISIILAFFIALVNSIISIYIIKKNFKKAFNQFLKVFFLSLLIRFFTVLLIIALILIFTDVDKLAFSLTFIFTLFLSILIEIIYLNIKKNLINLQK